MDNLEYWQIWIIIAIILFIIEAFQPIFIFACFGLGCLASGLFALLGLGLTSQLIVFSIISIIVFFGVRPFYYKYICHPSRSTPTNVEALVGKEGVVSERIDPQRNKGRVKVGGEDWRGVSQDQTPIDKDAVISVVKVDGVKLIVKKIC
jgi:membrane protein implicated in regulation of membrane protease activity